MHGGWATATSNTSKEPDVQTQRSSPNRCNTLHEHRKSPQTASHATTASKQLEVAQANSNDIKKTNWRIVSGQSLQTSSPLAKQYSRRTKQKYPKKANWVPSVCYDGDHCNVMQRCTVGNALLVWFKALHGQKCVLCLSASIARRSLKLIYTLTHE